MKAATSCIFEGEEVSISEALMLRDGSRKPLYFTCIHCSEPVKPHKAGENHSPAHFEHHERNSSCPHSDGKFGDEYYSVNDERAIEGYGIDKNLRVGSRNKTLVDRCKVRDNYTCQACGFKLKLYGKYVIECHHKNPIGMGGVRDTSLDDLVCLCPTCHRIAHTRKEPLDIDEIIAIRT